MFEYCKSIHFQTNSYTLWSSLTTTTVSEQLHTMKKLHIYLFHIQCVFDYQPGDVFACVANLGWITGHSYVVYGPLCNGATTVLFESTATYPDAGMLSSIAKACTYRWDAYIFVHTGRYWEMIERLKVNQFFTVPSAIRHLMKVGDELVTKYNLSTLKTIASSEYTMVPTIFY